VESAVAGVGERAIAAESGHPTAAVSAETAGFSTDFAEAAPADQGEAADVVSILDPSEETVAIDLERDFPFLFAAAAEVSSGAAFEAEDGLLPAAGASHGWNSTGSSSLFNMLPTIDDGPRHEEDSEEEDEEEEASASDGRVAAGSRSQDSDGIDAGGPPVPYDERGRASAGGSDDDSGSVRSDSSDAEVLADLASEAGRLDISLQRIPDSSPLGVQSRRRHLWPSESTPPSETAEGSGCGAPHVLAAGEVYSVTLTDTPLGLVLLEAEVAVPLMQLLPPLSKARALQQRLRSASALRVPATASGSSSAPAASSGNSAAAQALPAAPVPVISQDATPMSGETATALEPPSSLSAHVPASSGSAGGNAGPASLAGRSFTSSRSLTPLKSMLSVSSSSASLVLHRASSGLHALAPGPAQLRINASAVLPVVECVLPGHPCDMVTADGTGATAFPLPADAATDATASGANNTSAGRECERASRGAVGVGDRLLAVQGIRLDLLPAATLPDQPDDGQNEHDDQGAALQAAQQWRYTQSVERACNLIRHAMQALARSKELSAAATSSAGAVGAPAGHGATAAPPAAHAPGHRIEPVVLTFVSAGLPARRAVVEVLSRASAQLADGGADSAPVELPPAGAPVAAASTVAGLSSDSAPAPAVTQALSPHTGTTDAASAWLVPSEGSGAPAVDDVTLDTVRVMLTPSAEAAAVPLDTSEDLTEHFTPATARSVSSAAPSGRLPAAVSGLHSNAPAVTAEGVAVAQPVPALQASLDPPPVASRPVSTVAAAQTAQTVPEAGETRCFWLCGGWPA
jgi:hypothetical protein